MNPDRATNSRTSESWYANQTRTGILESANQGSSHSAYWGDQNLPVTITMTNRGKPSHHVGTAGVFLTTRRQTTHVADATSTGMTRSRNRVERQIPTWHAPVQILS